MRLFRCALTLVLLTVAGGHAWAATLEQINGVRIQAVVTGTQKFVVKGKPVDVDIVGSGLIRISGKRVQGSVTRTYRYGGGSGRSRLVIGRISRATPRIVLEIRNAMNTQQATHLRNQMRAAVSIVVDTRKR